MNSSNTDLNNLSFMRIFPMNVYSASMPVSLGALEHLHPDERQFTTKMAKKREREFCAGRHCAHLALTQLGITETPILVNHDRSPVWPQGVTGSISHTDDFCGVVVSNSNHYVSLGLDIERIRPIDYACKRMICTPPELKWLATLDKESHCSSLVLIFSAKECWYKCQYTLSHTFQTFDQAEVKIDLRNKSFQVINLDDIGGTFPARSVFSGKFAVADGLVFTGMALATSTTSYNKCPLS